jgi:hypothetical protein
MAAPFTTILNVEWLNQNAMRAFPIADGCTETDTTGTIKLPRDLIVDLLFTVDTTSALDTGGFYISQVAVFGPGVTLTFSYFDGTSSSKIGVVAVNNATHIENKTYFLIGEGSFTGCTGKITIGDLTETLKYSGVFNFTLADTRLVPTLFRPDIRGVKSIQVVNQNETSAKLDGLVQLRAGQNMRLRVDDVNKIIYFDALKSSDLNDACGCDNDVSLAPAIRTLNGVSPDSNGNIQLVPDACMEFRAAGTGTLEVHDTCSEPCCGSPELTVVDQDLEQLNMDVRTMRNLMERLETHLLTLDNLRTAIQNTGLLGDTPPGTN